MEIICKEHGITKKEIEEKAVSLLSNYDWPGNIRELRNVIDRLIILSDNKITTQDVNLNQ